MRHVRMTRVKGRLILRIEESNMGKKYEAYQKAVVAEGLAKSRLSDTEGGSTKGAIQESKANVEQATRNSNDTWKQFLDDPEG